MYLFLENPWVLPVTLVGNLGLCGNSSGESRRISAILQHLVNPDSETGPEYQECSGKGYRQYPNQLITDIHLNIHCRDIAQKNDATILGGNSRESPLDTCIGRELQGITPGHLRGLVSYSNQVLEPNCILVCKWEIYRNRPTLLKREWELP